ncbi:MAG: hypothetical protein KCCBMMGE_00287 [Candidatus Methanoperedenaceae archaeon GB37]|nr:MAG: hypothetical protein KCCBMMGE_00287 [Candidatus Methanoperedenaceae archaeon GB37]CAD7779029.1 hypothetical protein DMNBHIDG_01937 [Candidatus Methanoperedenaceae archaeon GB37]
MLNFQQMPTILVIEDDKDIANLIAYHLEKEKYKVVLRRMSSSPEKHFLKADRFEE